MAVSRPLPIDPNMSPELIAREICAAFQELLTTNQCLVGRFRRTFYERMTLPGEPESKGGAAGLAEMLAGLLGMFPDEPQKGRELTAGERDNEDTDIKVFGQQFSEALQILAIDHPTVLIVFKKHQQEELRSTEEFLTSLVKMYAENEVGFSY